MAPWIVGLGLSQVGEFSFVLARVGIASGSLSKPAYDFALTCTVVTMAISPLVSRLALPLGRAWRGWRKSEATTAPVEPPRETLAGHVIVGGYGRSGTAVARVLRSAGIPFIAIELDHSVYGRLSAEGLPAVWGDITGEEILRAGRIEKARILLLTIPDASTIHLCLERARRLNPKIVVIARAVREHHIAELTRLGVDVAVQSEFEGGVEMVRQALARYECDRETASQLLSAARREFYEGAF
jgi:CPA2 family monovalent cation:H+ antiporter-2